MGFMEEPIKVLPQSRPPTEATGEGVRAVSERGKEGSANMCKMWINPKMARPRRRPSDESVVSAYKTATKFREVSGGNGGGLHAKKNPSSTSPANRRGGPRTQRNSCLWLLEVERLPSRSGVCIAGLRGMAMVTQVKEPTSQAYPRMR